MKSVVKGDYLFVFIFQILLLKCPNKNSFTVKVLTELNLKHQ